MQDVLQPHTLAQIVDEQERSNILYIKGRRYKLDQIVMQSSADVIFARLVPDSGLWEIGDLSKAHVDLTDAPF